MDHFSSSIVIRRGTTRKRQIALTFDDGPDPLTRAYLDCLDRFAARATFFLVGKMCEERRDDLLEIVRRGHEVASHSFSHRKLTELTRGEIADELSRSNALLPPAKTERPLFRPPSGATSPRTLFWCATAGFTTVLWSLDSEDWRLHDAREVERKLKPDLLRPGDIVLLHEGQAWTLDALPHILEELTCAGFELVTVGELLEG